MPEPRRILARDPLRYFDAAAAVTMIAAVAYLVGYSYFAAYYDELGFGAANIVLPSTSYIRESLFPLVVCVGLFVVANIRIANTKFQRTVVFLQNVALLPAVAIILLDLHHSFESKRLPVMRVNIVAIVALSVFSALIIYSSYHSTRVVDTLAIPTKWRFVVAVMLVIYTAVSAATMLGVHQARFSVHDRFSLRQRFVIQTTILELKILEGRELILVLSQDNTYYVLALPPRNSTLSPTPYIIPARQVAAAHFEARQPSESPTP
jgi:hypothetical protein